MNNNNHTAETEIASAIKKIQVLGPITLRDCSTIPEIQISIEVLGYQTFRDCSIHSNELKFKSNQSNQKRKPGKRTRKRVEGRNMASLGKFY